MLNCSTNDSIDYKAEYEKLKAQLLELRSRCHPSATDRFDSHQWGLLMIVPVNHKCAK